MNPSDAAFGRHAGRRIASAPGALVTLIAEALARPLVALWLATSAFSWRRSPTPHDSPHVHAPGVDPDRVLILGDGAAVGRGVRTHDLGLPGYLARSLTALTDRATDVDIVVDARMDVDDALPAVRHVDLSRFDIIVISLGANEALDLMSVRTWSQSLTRLLDHLDQRTPASVEVFVLSIPLFSLNPRFPRPLASIVDRHLGAMNAATADLVTARPRVHVIPVGNDEAFELEGAHLYQRWADGIASRMVDFLDPDRLRAADTAAFDERQRREALRRLEAVNVGTDPFLDSLAMTARRVLGTPMAAVTFIGDDEQVMKAASGLEPIVVPRSEAFCDITIRRRGHLVIEDAALDSRYADYSTVVGELGVRFYAGYPLESPDGQRIGALCVMDTAPRSFTADEAVVLRNLAFRVQEHLWRQVADA